ncbi:MAG: LPXTG cell wall anchor domain-containing protein [Deltaproteobacteria bacterium]|nr:LPXTG cell wall anchor domain-containing protein [Deltaproteobacteria bacterium]
MPRPWPLVLIVLVLALALSACEFLPQTGTEWGIALGIFGVLFVAVVYLAWKGSRKPKE